MVNARFECGRDFIAMRVNGHAGFAELGKDPVCAGASTLAMTVAQCIAIMGDEGKLQKKPNIVIRDGRVSVAAKPKPECFDEALHIFYMGEVGMQILAEAYPEHAHLTPFVLPTKG